MVWHLNTCIQFLEIQKMTTDIHCQSANSPKLEKPLNFKVRKTSVELEP